MRTLRRYLATEIMAATALVFAALVMLFAFFDLIEQLKDLGRGVYTLRRILLYVLLLVPVHVYELFPIAALIGTLFALAQLVAGSEYTVMRTSGVSTARFAGTLAMIGLAFAVVTFVFGELISPGRRAVRAAPALAGDHRAGGPGVPLGAVGQGRQELHQRGGGAAGLESEGGEDLRVRRRAPAALDQPGRRRHLPGRAAVAPREGRRAPTSRTCRPSVREIGEIQWESVLDPDLLNVIMQKPEKMSAWRLYSYAQHLRENRQKALRYEIALWAKFTHPARGAW